MESKSYWLNVVVVVMLGLTVLGRRNMLALLLVLKRLALFIKTVICMFLKNFDWKFIMKYVPLP